MLNIKTHKKIINIILAIYAFEGLAANLAHPITPHLITNLNLPTYMFGLVFAAMALTNFLMSPFWGKQCEKTSVRTILLLGCVGYGIGQLIFGLFNQPLLMIIGRLIAGGFVSAIFVAIPYYIVITETENKAQYITKAMTLFTVFGTLGYFIGGYIGQFNIYYPLILQVISLILCGVLFYFFIPYNMPIKIKTQNIVAKNTTRNLVFIFVVVLLVSTASTSLTQTFSYYITNILKLSSFDNGITKGTVGILALLVNYFITLRLVGKQKTNRYLVYILVNMALLLCLFLNLSTYTLVFLTLGIIVMVLDTMVISMLQDRCVHYSDLDSQAHTLGRYNAMKSLGMIGGALTSSWIYDIQPLSPFGLSMILYIMGIGFMVKVGKRYE